MIRFRDLWFYFYFAGRWRDTLIAKIYENTTGLMIVTFYDILTAFSMSLHDLLPKIKAFRNKLVSNFSVLNLINPLLLKSIFHGKLIISSSNNLSNLFPFP